MMAREELDSCRSVLVLFDGLWACSRTTSDDGVEKRLALSYEYSDDYR